MFVKERKYNECSGLVIFLPHQGRQQTQMFTHFKRSKQSLSTGIHGNGKDAFVHLTKLSKTEKIKMGKEMCFAVTYL